jgi:hypothetical protein
LIRGKPGDVLDALELHAIDDGRADQRMGEARDASPARLVRLE